MTLVRFLLLPATAALLVICQSQSCCAAAAGATVVSAVTQQKSVSAAGATTTGGGGSFLSPNMTRGGANAAMTPGSGNRALTNMSTRTANRSEPPGVAADPTEGDEFLIERNRGRGTFVGHDTSDGIGFVGEGRANVSKVVRSAISSLRIGAQNAMLNPMRPARAATSLYDPRLVVGFDYAKPPAQLVSSNLTQRLMESKAIQRMGAIEVSVEAGKATLRGEVAAERDRALAEQLLLFEPGIDSVQNLLTVKPPSSSPSNAPAP